MTPLALRGQVRLRVKLAATSTHAFANRKGYIDDYTLTRWSKSDRIHRPIFIKTKKHAIVICITKKVLDTFYLSAYAMVDSELHEKTLLGIKPSRVLIRSW